MRYNRAGRASGADSFTIAVAPDLQQEVLDAKDTRLTKRFQWLVDNRQTLNLKCVLQVGDFMNWDTPDHIQYERASAAVKILDEAGLPFVFAIGNHDTQATGGTPEKPGGSARPGNTHDNQRNTTVYNRYFPLARFKALGGVYEPGKIMQTYHDSVTNPVRLFTIDTKEGSIKSRVFCPSTGKDKTDGSALEIKGVNWVPATAAPWTKQRAG